jgi:NCAIR mutase (PurE)-related protein
MRKKTEQSLTELADAAFKEAARIVIERAKRFGTPLIIRQDGKMKKVDPHEFQLPETKPKKRRPRKK